jgi:hypothetical protein
VTLHKEREQMGAHKYDRMKERNITLPKTSKTELGMLDMPAKIKQMKKQSAKFESDMRGLNQKLSKI